APWVVPDTSAPRIKAAARKGKPPDPGWAGPCAKSNAWRPIEGWKAVGRFSRSNMTPLATGMLTFAGAAANESRRSKATNALRPLSLGDAQKLLLHFVKPRRDAVVPFWM